MNSNKAKTQERGYSPYTNNNGTVLAIGGKVIVS